MQSPTKDQGNVKEISPGIFLHKILQTTTRNNQTFQVYVFKIQNNRLNVLEFTADFTGSDNIILENRHGLVAITTIDPYQQQVVAKLILQTDWKLRSKFKFALKPAPKIIQQEQLKDVQTSLNKEIEKTTQILNQYPLCLYGISEVQNIISSYDAKFIDSQFLPNDDAIYGFTKGKKHLELDTIIHWRRPEEYMNETEEQPIDIFYDDIEPADIVLGENDNIQLYSAIACLTERPALIDRLFITKNITPQGIYRVKICKNGEWQIVSIDDYFPCYPFGSPVFSKNHQNELWLQILEKAYAKLMGNYLSLQNLTAKDVLVDLTGCPVETILFQQEENGQFMNNFNYNLWEDIIQNSQEGYLQACFQNTPITMLENPEVYDENLPGPVYTIIQTKQYKGIQLLNIRNPWGQFEWQGDWCTDSKLWTPDFIQECGVDLSGNEQDNFWISYQDFLKEFVGFYVIKIKNWDETRIKGKFIRIQDNQDINQESFQSKFYYQVDIPSDTKINIGLHQEDQNIESVKELRKQIDLGLAIFKKNQNSELHNINIPDIKKQREIQYEMVLEEGTYLVLPRSTGCLIKEPQFENDPIYPLTEKQKNNLQENKLKLSGYAKSVIKDIFRKFDIFMTRELGYHEFKGFFEAIERKISQKDFEQTILTKYQSSRSGLTIDGFIEFFQFSLQLLGENIIMKWFEYLGYNKDLKSIRSRNFILSFHSDQEIQVLVRDALSTDLEHRANILQISGNGEEVSIDYQGIRLFYSYNKFLDCYTYAAINELEHEIEVILNCQKSQNALYSTKNGISKKIIQPQQLEFIMHLMKNPNKNQEFKHVMDFQAKNLKITQK